LLKTLVLEQWNQEKTSIVKSSPRKSCPFKHGKGFDLELLKNLFDSLIGSLIGSIIGSLIGSLIGSIIGSLIGSLIGS